MARALAIRVTDELLDWLKKRSRGTGISIGRLVLEQPEAAKAEAAKQRLLRHAGAITEAPQDVSLRTGFSH